jgi:hypothetical protein
LRRHLAKLASALKEGRPILGKARPAAPMLLAIDKRRNQPSAVDREA